MRQVDQAARSLGLALHVLKASNERDLDAVFVTLVQLGAGALVITADGLFADSIHQIAALTRRSLIPATFQFREFGCRRFDELWTSVRANVPPGWNSCRSDFERRETH
jgi:hypothetical protein